MNIPKLFVLKVDVLLTFSSIILNRNYIYTSNCIYFEDIILRLYLGRLTHHEEHSVRFAIQSKCFNAQRLILNSRSDSGSSRSAVDQRQLPKTATLGDAADFVVVYIHL